MPSLFFGVNVIYSSHSMALNDFQQAFEAVSRATSILIVARANSAPDTIACVTACLHFLDAIGKHPEAVVPGFHRKTAPDFLPHLDEIRSELGAFRNLRLIVDVSRVPLQEFFYDVRDGKLDITLVPKHGAWTPDDLSHEHDRDRCDLIVALDCPDNASLGDIAETHGDLLHRIPVLNIDANPSNERWGTYNLVDATAATTAEILLRLFEAWDGDVRDPIFATALLAGIMAKTNSFRTPSVTPDTLATTAKLVAAGGDRDTVVRGLWRTKDVPTLQLW